MSKTEPTFGSQSPIGYKGIITALFLSAGAFYYAFTNTGFPLTSSGLSWIALILVLFLGIATTISYIGLARLYPVTPLNLMALYGCLNNRPRSLWTRIGKIIAAWASHLCYWMLPCLWLSIASSNATYLISQVWPQTYFDNPRILILSALILAVGLSYLSFRRMKAIIMLMSIIGLVQMGVFAFFFVQVRIHRPNEEGSQAYVLDSTGNVTQFVQDTVPDTAATSRNSNLVGDPATQMPKDIRTIPKVDSRGNAIWVYDAVDARGNVILDARGNPIIVPTDAEGKLAALPAGAAKAMPERFKLSYHNDSTQADDVQFKYHFDVDLRPPGYNYAQAEACIALMASAIFLLTTSLGQDAKHATRPIRSLVFISILLVQCAIGCFAIYFCKAKLLAFASSATALTEFDSAPVGDIIQMIGSWAFGSPMAGWWLMASQATIVILAAMVAVSGCIHVGVGPPQGLWGNEVGFGYSAVPQQIKTPSHFRTLLRAGIAVLFCALAARDPANNFQLLGAGAVGTLRNRIATFIPDPLNTLMFVTALPLLGLYILTCLASLSAYIAWPNRIRAKYITSSVIGLLIGVACIAFYLAAPFMLKGELAKESVGAWLFCAVWGIVVFIRSFMRRHRAAT